MVKYTFFVFFSLLFSCLAKAGDNNDKIFYLTLKNHLFYPSVIVVPKNTKVKLIITNEDDTPEEFDSFDLNREKVLFPKRKTTIFIGPLKKGVYTFFGEYNPHSAQGKVLVDIAPSPEELSDVN